MSETVEATQHPIWNDELWRNAVMFAIQKNDLASLVVLVTNDVRRDLGPDINPFSVLDWESKQTLGSFEVNENTKKATLNFGCKLLNCTPLYLALVLGKVKITQFFDKIDTARLVKQRCKKLMEQSSDLPKTIPLVLHHDPTQRTNTEKSLEECHVCDQGRSAV
jgi:hypothetical protein